MPRGKGFTHGELPPGARPFLQVKLKRGWRLDPDGPCFLTARGVRQTIEGLPPGARVVPQIELPPRGARLSAAERELERFVHVLLPRDADPRRVLRRVEKWACVEDVQLPPDVSLPGDLE